MEADNARESYKVTEIESKSDIESKTSQSCSQLKGQRRSNPLRNNSTPLHASNGSKRKLSGCSFGTSLWRIIIRQMSPKKRADATQLW